jgi:alcohol dehydrogenase
MQALYFEGKGQLAWRDDRAIPLAGDDQAIVRPIAATTCDLDRAIIDGILPYPSGFAIGHEAVAEVIEVGDGVRTVVPGDIVVVPWKPACGKCDICRAGLTASCEVLGYKTTYGLPFGGGPEGKGVGGLFSDRVWVPFADAMLVKVPDEVDPVAVASIGDNLTDTYINVQKAMTRHPGAPVLVWGGAGKIGPYSVDHALAAGAASVDYIDHNPIAREIAESLGARVHAEYDPAWERRFPVVIFAGTTPASLRTAFTALRPGGHLSQVMIFFQDTPIPMGEIYFADITFSNGRPSTRPHIPAVLELCRCGKLHPEKTLSKVIAWDDAPEALLERTLMPVVARQPILSPRRFACLPID